MPNFHLHPQLESSKDKNQQMHPDNKCDINSNEPSSKTQTQKTGFVKTHRRSTSHHNFTQVIKTVDIQPNINGGFEDQPQKEVNFDNFMRINIQLN